MTPAIVWPGPILTRAAALNKALSLSPAWLPPQPQPGTPTPPPHPRLSGKRRRSDKRGAPSSTFNLPNEQHLKGNNGRPPAPAQTQTRVELRREAQSNNRGKSRFLLVLPVNKAITRSRRARQRVERARGVRAGSPDGD